MFEDIKDKYNLIFITVFSIILAVYYINFNNNIGIFCSDVYVYLLNSLYYTGSPILQTQNIYLSPLICFLTSLIFRAGFVSKTAIYIVTGAFAICGNIGFYLLLKKYFSPLLSLCGCIIYISLPLYLIWFSNGTLDIPAVSILIWIALFTIKAVDENPKYFTPLIILIVLGIFTRYTILLCLPVFIMYYIFKKGFKISKIDLKYIIIGLIIATFLVFITVSYITSLSDTNTFGAENQISEGINGIQGSEIDPAYNTDITYYLTNIPNFISSTNNYFDANPVLKNPTPLSWAVILILVIGLGLWIISHKRSLKKSDIYPLIFFTAGIISFSHVSAVITTILVLIAIYLMAKDSPNKNQYFFLAWIFSNIIFYSYYNIKVNRYFLPVIPPIIYFLLLSVESIEKKIKPNILPIVLIVVFIIQAFAFPLTFDSTYDYKAVEDISDYANDNNLTNIAVYNIRPYNWWLGNNITGITSDNINAIKDSNASYYISNTKLDNFSEVKSFEKLHLYNISV